MSKIKLPCFGIIVTLQDDSGTVRSQLIDDGDCILYRKQIDVLESFILSSALAGLDIKSPAFIEAIERTVNALDDYWDEDDEESYENRSVSERI